jgi:AraC family transcriptional regulator of adaptative response/methylated-DNA-[protein]-cysteine methyltransferase
VSYRTIAAAIRYLDANAEAQPSLAELAHAVGWSESHLQREFTQWAGVSPKRFLQVLTHGRARQWLRDSQPVIAAAFASGLSGGGRLHDLFVACEAVTPGEVARLGDGLRIDYGFAETPYGRALFGSSARGLCHLRFAATESLADAANGAGADAALERELAAEWPLARRVRDDEAARRIAARVFAGADSVPGAAARFAQPLALWLKGTNFQTQVWQALLRLPAGTLCSYGDLAQRLGQPGAARAVGNAIARNPVAWVIPCHRVIRDTGALGGYRWGLERKRTMLAREYAHRPAAPAAGA